MGRSFRTLTKVTILVGVLSLAALVLCHLALTDIAHGEADLTLE